MTNDKKDFFFSSCPPLLLKVKTHYSITLFRIPDDVPYYPPKKICLIQNSKHHNPALV